MILEKEITSIKFEMNEYVSEKSLMRVSTDKMNTFSENEKKLASNLYFQNK